MPEARIHRHALRGPILHFLADPGDDDQPTDGSVAYWEDGLILIENGLVRAVGHAADVIDTLPSGTTLDHYPDKLIMPGFIDPHLHFSQLDIIASYGRQLIDWLNTYTFPEEARFSDRDYADAIAEAFIKQMLAHGTTTALAFCTSHPNSVEALFSAASRRQLRMLAGKVLMDRNAPDNLCDSAEGGIRDSRALLERWHGQGRLEYALTPRFAPTSSPEQLAAAGRMLADYPGIVMQTHLAENRKEIEWVASLYPEAKDYLDVYDRFGLLQQRSVFAHGIHIDDDVRRRLHDAGGAIAFCPTSNLFLGSGLFDWRAARQQGVSVGIASDIGGGTSLSQLQTLQDAYKVCQMKGQSLPPWQAFYRLTRGNAQMLGLEQHIGSFETGREADIVVLDPASTPSLARKEACSPTLGERLFNLMMLGDDRSIAATYVMGRCLHGGVTSAASR